MGVVHVLRWGRPAWVSPSLLLACIAMAADQPPTPVVDLLSTLMATGVNVVYSSELVPPDLEAPISLAASDPMSRVVEALSAHHLELRSVGPGRFIVGPPPPHPP